MHVGLVHCRNISTYQYIGRNDVSLRWLVSCRMRLQRIEELKHGAPSSSSAAAAAAETLGFAEVALDISSIAEAPVQPRKRRRLNVAELDEDADGEDSSEDDDLTLDWRAKTV